MKVLKICSVVLARFFLSSIFLASAMSKMFHWQETEHTLLNALCDWQNHMGFSETISNYFGALTPWTSPLLLIATMLELIGGLLILLGIKERLGASLLLVFLLPATLLFHQFWFVEGINQELQAMMFLKNMAVMGGLILMILHGAQAHPRESYASMSMG